MATRTKNQRAAVRSSPTGAQALWNLRWPVAYLCGPVLGALLVNVLFGMTGRLWLMAGGFFLFSLMLFGILLRGEMGRIRATSLRHR